MGASHHYKLDPTNAAGKWDGAWRALLDATYQACGSMTCGTRSRLLEAGEPGHVVESITGHISRLMLEHYSHIRL